ncbi:MAG: hypothetical protein AB9869_12555 [Verrucomicrobiia bacterium]
MSGSSPGPSSGFEVFVPGRQDGFGQNPVYRSANLIWAHRSRFDFLVVRQQPPNQWVQATPGSALGEFEANRPGAPDLRCSAGAAVRVDMERVWIFAPKAPGLISEGQRPGNPAPHGFVP